MTLQAAAPAEKRMAAPPRGSAREVLGAFARLGLTSFGGPIAHLGYFREAFVVRRRWLDDATFADLVALCQFLPGPASSQVGFTLGLMRGGWRGGLAAWAGFTLPSAVLLGLFAYGADALGGRMGEALLHGLKLVAVAIVAQAVFGMARSLTPDRPRAAIAAAAIVIVTMAGGAVGQIAAILAGSVAGLAWCRGAAPPAIAGHLAIAPVPRRTGIVLLALFAALLALPPLVIAAGAGGPALDLFAAFYRSGALVFGGGHVVLPLLRAAVVEPGWVSDSAFLAGYGAAQAVPGPLFTFSAYLGAAMRPPMPGGAIGALLALVAIFLPGLLLVAGALPFWDAFRRRAAAQSMMRGANAAVVGVLAAALYDPVWVSAVHRPIDFAIAAIGFVLLAAWRAPPLLVVVLTALSAVALAAI